LARIPEQEGGLATQPTNEPTTTIFVPEGFTDFRCARCGDCCSHPPRIDVSPAKYRRILRLLLDADFPFPPRDAVTRDEADPDARAAFALVGERCVFLTDEGQCFLCDAGAPELRGAWCLSFPVIPLVTPRGVNFALSFACPQTARLLRSRTPLNILAVTIPDDPPRSAERPFSKRHRIPTLPGGPTLDWAGHRLVEGMLLAVARDWDLRLDCRLILMPLVLAHLLDGCGGPETHPTLRDRAGHVSEAIGPMVERTRSYRPDRAAHYEALAGVFGRRIGLRTRSALRKHVDEALRVVRGRRGTADSAELGARLADLYRKHYKPRAARLEHVLGNYVICRLFASREILTGGVYKGVRVIGYLVGLARFFAATSAAREHCSVNLDLLTDSVRLVEKLFAHNSHVFAFLDTAEPDHLTDPAHMAALVRI
jgi:hypothetical protein